MYELIAANKRKSTFLIILFSIVILALGWLLSYISEAGPIVIVYAAIFNIIAILTSYYQGDKIVLKTVNAQPIEKAQDPELYRLIENLAITAGMPMPKVYLIPDDSLNAFATGRDPEHASVAITRGLRRILTKTELEAVMAHELSHIKNYDIRVLLITSVLLGMITLMADLGFRTMRRGGNRKNKGAPIIMIVAIIGLILAPIIGQLIKFAISRKRELLADASGVMLTRYPEALVSALQKIAKDPQVDGHNEAIAHMFIFPPFKKTFWAKLFSTHPPIEERIKTIRDVSLMR